MRPTKSSRAANVHRTSDVRNQPVDADILPYAAWLVALTAYPIIKPSARACRRPHATTAQATSRFHRANLARLIALRTR